MSTRGRDAGRLGLHRLRAPDLAAVRRHGGVVRHVLRLERRDAQPSRRRSRQSAATSRSCRRTTRCPAPSASARPPGVRAAQALGSCAPPGGHRVLGSRPARAATQRRALGERARREPEWRAGRTRCSRARRCRPRAAARATPRGVADLDQQEVGGRRQRREPQRAQLVGEIRLRLRGQRAAALDVRVFVQRGQPGRLRRRVHRPRRLGPLQRRARPPSRRARSRGAGRRGRGPWSTSARRRAAGRPATAARPRAGPTNGTYASSTIEQPRGHASSASNAPRSQ